MTLREEVIIAERIMNNAFADKKDRGGQPYTEHLNYVYLKMTKTHRSMTVALLHDLLEDCPDWDAERLAKIGFSGETIAAIEAITKRPNEPYQDYLNRVAENETAKVVKLVDLEHNMQVARLPKLTDKDIERLKKYHNAYKFLNQ